MATDSIIVSSYGQDTHLTTGSVGPLWARRMEPVLILQRSPQKAKLTGLERTKSKAKAMSGTPVMAINVKRCGDRRSCRAHTTSSTAVEEERRRKTMRNSLKERKLNFKNIDFDFGRRAESLSVEEFIELSNEVNTDTD